MNIVMGRLSCSHRCSLFSTPVKSQPFLPVARIIGADAALERTYFKTTSVSSCYGILEPRENIRRFLDERGEVDQFTLLCLEKKKPSWERPSRWIA
jgi:hypothetical protein